MKIRFHKFYIILSRQEKNIIEAKKYNFTTGRNFIEAKKYKISFHRKIVATRFELATSASRTQRSTKLSHAT